RTRGAARRVPRDVVRAAGVGCRMGMTATAGGVALARPAPAPAMKKGLACEARQRSEKPVCRPAAA
ncbi:hypothetical protein, partial [Burkholderia metallica]|uniref:hypothetical protein n=1 Tax=Burkholderia metallica TaxID=488729 RepID=UPI001C2E497B